MQVEKTWRLCAIAAALFMTKRSSTFKTIGRLGLLKCKTKKRFFAQDNDDDDRNHDEDDVKCQK